MQAAAPKIPGTSAKDPIYPSLLGLPRAGQGDCSRRVPLIWCHLSSWSLACVFNFPSLAYLWGPACFPASFPPPLQAAVRSGARHCPIQV